jgi:cobalt-zinc-cadmium efflux system outer membrane protein
VRRTAVVMALVGLVLAPGNVSAEPRPDTRNATVEQDPTFSEQSTIDDYLDYALANNRGLKAAEATWRSMTEDANQAGYLEDPELSFEYMFEQHDLQYAAGLTQMIPGFGKLKLKKQIAGSRASSAEYDYKAMRLMVFERVIKTFYDYHYLGRAAAVTDENIALLTDLEQVMLTRYKSGTVQYSDMLKVQVEKDRLLNRRESLKDMRSVKSSELCAILDLPINHILPWPKATRSADSLLSSDDLVDMLETLNPELKALDATIQGLSAAEKLAKKSYTPDFMVGAGYMVMPEAEEGSTPTDAAVRLGITIPLWWGKYRSATRQAALTRDSAISRRSQMESDLQVDLKKAVFDLHDAERQIKLLKESLIPKAQQAYEVARQEFMGGTTGFMTLIDAQRTLFEFSLMLERAEADREIAFGEIGCCVGKYDVRALTGNASEKQNDNGGKWNDD